MYLQQLEWHHVNAELSTCYAGLNKPRVIWKNTSGETRVYARLYKCSLVSYTCWMKDPDLTNPITQAIILLQLSRALKLRWNQIRKYLKED